jgi:hypothetical protein
MINNVASFNIGTIENGIPHKSLFRQAYTFTEVMKMFDIAKQNKYSKKLYKSPAWVKIEEKQVLPGRTASSLAGTYRKYERMGKDEALRSILKRGRYSLHFQYAPGFSKEIANDNTPSTQISTQTNKDNLSPLRANFLSDEEGEVQDNEEQPSEEDNDEMQEFLLAVDDLESVLSYKESDDRTYNLQTNIKKNNARNLSDAYTQLEEDSQLETNNHKRVKIDENTEISNPVHNKNEKVNWEEIDGISLYYKNKECVRYISKSGKKSQKLELFNSLHDQLQYLSRIYVRKIEEIHMMFLEVSCDIKRLKKLLDDDPKAIKQKWDELRDLAVQSCAGTPEFRAICTERGKEEVSKRRMFLEGY